MTFFKALGRAESLGAELARRFERPIALGIREGLVEVNVVEINPQPRIVESPAAKPITRASAASEPRERSEDRGAPASEQPISSQSPFVGADEDGNIIGPLVKAGLPNLQTAMPSYAELTSEEIVDLARYIHFLRQQARFTELSRLADTAAGDRTAGEAYFNGAANCRSCHSVTGDLAASAGSTTRRSFTRASSDQVRRCRAKA